MADRRCFSVKSVYIGAEIPHQFRKLEDLMRSHRRSKTRGLRPQSWIVKPTVAMVANKLAMGGDRRSVR